MKTGWYIIYMSVMAMVFFFLPIAQYYYETDDEKPVVLINLQHKTRRILEVAFYEFVTLVIVVVTLVIGYSYLNEAQIPVVTVGQVFSSDGWVELDTKMDYATVQSQIVETTIVSLPVSFPIFAMAFMAFIGWWLFVLFGGVGLSALPLDMINDFLNRPELLTTKQAAEKKMILKKRTQELIDQGSRIKDEEKELQYINGYWAKRKAKGKVETSLKRWKANVINLDYVIYNC